MQFENTFKKYRKIVNKELERFFNEKINEVPDGFLKESYNYLKEFSLRPGKRIRSIATIMAYKSINDIKEERIYPISIALELTHDSYLIHDDIMDEDLLRRNKPTMHKIFESYFKKHFIDKKYKGNLFDSYSKRFSISMAIIQGNILYSLSHLLILELKLNENMKNKALNILNKSCCRVNEGQILDLLLATKEKLNEKDYLDMVKGKTASLFSTSIVLGAMLNHAKQHQLENLEKYALSIGIAFQIRDDIIDIDEGMDKGREAGTDLRIGNKTFMVIKALQNSSEEEKNILLNVLGNDKATKEDIKKAIEIIKCNGGMKYATDYAKKKITEAKKYLEKADLNKTGYEFFKDLADYVVRRKK